MTSSIQNQMDYIVLKFQESMLKFESLIQANKDLSQENKDLRSSLENLGSKFNSMCIDFNSFMVAHSDNVKTQSKVNEQFDNMHMNQASINSVLSKDIANVINECSKSKDNIKEVLKTLAILSEKIDFVDSKYAEVSNQIAKLDDPVNFCRTKVTKLKNMILEDESIIKDIKSSCDDQQKKLTEHDKYFFQIHEKLNKSIDDSQQNQQKIINSIYEIVENKISEIPKPVIPNLEDAKKMFLNQLEPVSLDAKNAAIRSVNTDTKLHLLEKKIEQLKLMLDQLIIGQ